MPKEILRLGLLVRRDPPVTRWGKGSLRPCGVLPQEPDLAPRSALPDATGAEVWYLGARDMTLYSGDTGHHRDNLASGRPAIWVALRGQGIETAETVCVTADPYEGEGYASDLDLVVEAVPMPASVQDRIAAFVAAHHVEIPFKKRQRVPVDPNAAGARAPRILQEDEKWVNPRQKR